MDFGALPPEINSSLMYTGAGSAPMVTAASAWNGIADELSTAASSIESLVTRLSTEEWVSSASLAMAAAAQPFLAWLLYRRGVGDCRSPGHVLGGRVRNGACHDGAAG